MGRQVPDISPEGLKELTRQYRESVDRDVVGWLLDGKFDPSSPELITTWRESAKLSKAGVSRLMGMSKQGYLKVENGDIPLTEHFLTRLRSLLVQLDSTGFEFHPSDKSKSALPFKDFYEKHIPRGRIPTPTQEWRRCANPDCRSPSPWFFAVHGKRVFCSEKCRLYVKNKRKIFGYMTHAPKPDSGRRILVKCPNCQHEFQTKGNVTSGPKGRRNSDGTYQSYREANHDEQEQVHEEERSLLPDGLLSNDQSRIQSSE